MWVTTISKHPVNHGITNDLHTVRIEEHLTELIPLEVFVADALPIILDAFDCEQSLSLVQPSAVQLRVRNDKQEGKADEDRDASQPNEDDLPTGKGGAVFINPFGYAVGHQATDDLGHAVSEIASKSCQQMS